MQLGEGERKSLRGEDEEGKSKGKVKIGTIQG